MASTSTEPGARAERVAVDRHAADDRAIPARSSGYHPLVAVAVAAAGGIIADRYLPLPVPLWWTAAAMAGLTWWFLYRSGRNRAAAAALLLSVASAGASWHHLRWNLFRADELGIFVGGEQRPVCVEALALAAPRRLPAPPFDPLRALPPIDRSRLELQMVRLRDGRSWRPVSGRTRLSVDGHVLGVAAGDRLRIFGQLATSYEAGNPGEFDFAGYQRGRRKLCSLRATHPDCVELVAPVSGWSVRGVVDAIRTAAGERLWRNLSYRHSGLAAALLLGVREQIEVDVREAFVHTGTVHLLAISGLHVGILAGALWFIFRLGLVPRRAGIATVAALVVVYALVTDARPPVIRATIMLLVVCGSLYLRRGTVRWNALAAAALVVLAVNPAELFNAGAQLSFLAAATLIWFAGAIVGRVDDPLQRLIRQTRRWPNRLARSVARRFAQVALAGLLIWLVAAPLIMARFHLISLAAPLLNAFLWVPVTLALLSGFGVLTVGWFVPPLAGPLAALCETSLSVLERVVESVARLDVSHLWVSGPAGWWLLGYYGLLASWVAWPRRRPPRRWCAGLLAFWMSVGLAPALLRAPNDGLRMTVLGVGHGSSVVVELPDGRTLLYDAGRLGTPRSAADSIAGYLWSRGIRRLDAVVISHADLDHYNALPKLLGRFAVGVVYVSPMMFESEGRALTVLREAIDEAGVPIVEIYSPQRLRAGRNVSIEVFHPTRMGVLGRDNANSIVLALEHRGRRILLPGDLESPGLEALMAEAPYDCDVLLAPHHGSPRSDPEGLATWCAPDWVLVSGRMSDDARSVAQSYRGRGSQVLHTAESGAVTVRIDRQGLEVETFRRGQ